MFRKTTIHSDETKPVLPVYQPAPFQEMPPPAYGLQPRRRRGCSCGCASLLLATLLLGFLLIYFLAPMRTTLLILGIDYSPPGSDASRSDTIILTTIITLEPYVGMLSIPRDLWVTIPGIGENRINTAHFFAELNRGGSGPDLALQTIATNFGIPVNYYLRLRFEAVKQIVDAMGGIDIYLPEPMAGYPAGTHHLTGNKALAFARNRLGSDDFFRMEQGQLLIKAIFAQMLSPDEWFHLPAVAGAIIQAIDTNIPIWQWPRLGLAVLRAGPGGIDNRVITRDLVTPFTTAGGANVLLPRWELINPLIAEMFK